MFTRLLSSWMVPSFRVVVLVCFFLQSLCVLFLPHCFTQTWVKQYFFIFPILEESKKLSYFFIHNDISFFCSKIKYLYLKNLY